jgi:hypothetical protein
VKQIRKRLTYANVMSSIAVFLVLGGATALAAGLAKNSVGTKQLKNNAVTTAKIKNDAVNGAKVNESTLGTVPSASNASHAGSADKATTATTADKATTATSADKATTATSADKATTALDSNALGGKAAGEYSVRYFARVSSGTNPTLTAGSPGVSVNSGRPFTGAATVVFPVDMTNCAITATPFSGGGTVLVARQSSISAGQNVAIIIENTSGTGLNEAFNVVGVC